MLSLLLLFVFTIQNYMEPRSKKRKNRIRVLLAKWVLTKLEESNSERFLCSVLFILSLKGNSATSKQVDLIYTDSITNSSYTLICD
jgi:hypothetical protein